jgi:hypothetical protein
MRVRSILWALLLVGIVSMGVGYSSQRKAILDQQVVNAQTPPPAAPRLMFVQRWSRPGEAGVACQAGEVLSGGGCTCPAGTLRSSYPSGQDGGPGTAWQCDGQCSGTGLKAVAVCCSVR